MPSPSKSNPALRVTGVLLCRDRVAIHLGGGGPDAIKALHGAASTFAEGELQGLLSGAIADDLFGGKVAIGVDPLLEFFSTQRILPQKEGERGESLIEELRNKYEGRLVAESMRTALSPKTHQTAIAVPRGELQETGEAFGAFAQGRVKFVSTTHAIHAMAADASPAPRRWSSEIRVFLGQHEGLVLFSVEGTLVARQIFEYPGQAQGAVVTAVNGMVAAVKEGLGLDSPDGVLFHVGKHDNSLAELCTSVTGLAAENGSHIQYDHATMAAALAFDGFRRKRQEVDFLNRAGNVSQQAGSRLVPIKSASLLAVSILGMGGYLWSVGNGVQAEIDIAMARAQEALDLYEGDTFMLEEAEDRLMKTVGVGEGFLMDRVYWADFLTELPRILPKGMTMTRIDAKYNFAVPEDTSDEEGEVATTTFDESSRYFELGLELPLETERSSTSEEVTALTKALKESELFSGSFSTIPTATVNPLDGQDGWKADITLRCSP